MITYPFFYKCLLPRVKTKRFKVKEGWAELIKNKAPFGGNSGGPVCLRKKKELILKY